MARQLTEEERLIIAMKNAEALAQTCSYLGQQIDAQTSRIDHLTGLVQTLLNKQANLETLYHKSLVAKYGTGPTAG